MRTIELANAILRQGGYTRAAAVSLAWRILNRYPERLREAAIDLARGGAPALQVNELSLEDVRDMAQVGSFEALELLEIMEEDPAAGDQLLMRLARHDGRGRP